LLAMMAACAVSASSCRVASFFCKKNLSKQTEKHGAARRGCATAPPTSSRSVFCFYSDVLLVFEDWEPLREHRQQPSVQQTSVGVSVGGVSSSGLAY